MIIIVQLQPSQMMIGEREKEKFKIWQTDRLVVVLVWSAWYHSGTTVVTGLSRRAACRLMRASQCQCQGGSRSPGTRQSSPVWGGEGEGGERFAAHLAQVHCQPERLRRNCWTWPVVATVGAAHRQCWWWLVCECMWGGRGGGATLPHQHLPTVQTEK